MLKRDLLEDLKLTLLNFNFSMIYIIHRLLVLLKNHLNYLKDSILECFYKKYTRLLLVSFFFLISITINDGKLKS